MKPAKHYRLCTKHGLEALARFEATDKKNPDASVEFWEQWYGKETPRQIKTQLECEDCEVKE
jgi:hypothetical protein